MTEKVVHIRGEGFTAPGLHERGVTREHPLRGFWLSHRLLQGSGIDPFKTIMSMTNLDEARAIIKATGKTIDGDYIEERIAKETWLRSEAKLKGLVTEDDHPLYFRLYRQPVRNPMSGWTFINIPAEYIPPGKMSFTLDDSFHNYLTLKGRVDSTTPPNIQPRVLSANEIRALIDTDGFPDDLDGRTPTRYIECQVWAQKLPIFEQVEAFMQPNRANTQEAEIVTFT